MIGRILPALGLVGILACAQEESLPEPIIDFNGDGIKDTLCIERRGSIKEPNNYDFVISAMLSDGFNTNQLETFIERGASNIGDGFENLAVLPCSIRMDDF